MDIQKIKLTEEERKLLSSFIGEEYAGHEIDFNRLMLVVDKIEQMTLKEVIGVAASKPYWGDDKLSVGIGFGIRPNDNLLFKKATDFPVCFTINRKRAWIQHYFAIIDGGDGHFNMTEVSASSKIEATWQLVVSFIKWYNSTK